MANTDAPNGFTPVKSLYGGTVRPKKLRIASAYGTAIRMGLQLFLNRGLQAQLHLAAQMQKHMCMLIQALCLKHSSQQELLQ